MGGGRTAQGLAVLAVLAAPVWLALATYHSMNSIDQALWVLGMLLVARLQNGGGDRIWLWLGAAIALVLFSPFAVWQQHGWPFLEFSRDAARYKVGEVSALERVASQGLAPEDRARVEILTGSFGETAAMTCSGPPSACLARSGRTTSTGSGGPATRRASPCSWCTNRRASSSAGSSAASARPRSSAATACRGSTRRRPSSATRSRRPLAELWPELELYR
jgi:hypothetical protein